MKATQIFERLNVDFKGPLPSVSNNRYILTIIDEYSRFPFAFPSADVTPSTIIQCLKQLFSIFGMCSYIHSDRWMSFQSQELKSWLLYRQYRQVVLVVTTQGVMVNAKGTMGSFRKRYWPHQNIANCPLLIGKQFFQMHYTLKAHCIVLLLIARLTSECLINCSNQY